MIKAKHVFFWTSNLKGHGFHGDKATIFLVDLEIFFIICAVCKALFSWNLSSTSKVMAIYMYDAENVEFKFSRLRRHLKWKPLLCFSCRWIGDSS